MGFMDKARELAAEQQQAKEEHQAAAREVTSRCPGSHYVTEVNKGSIRMQTWQGRLNEMYASGYRLAHVQEQDGNTIQVFEHHFH